MSTISAQETPVQAGAQYVSGELPTFNTGDIVPVGDSCAMKEIGEVEKSKNNQAQTDNIGTNDHGVVISGDFKLKAGADIPNIGDKLTSSEATPRIFVITTDVEITGFSKGGKPLMVKFDAEFWPAVDAAESA
ncbi:MAG: hypothetical protein ACPG32_04400 [Akkermansiaceae bacterium]